MFPMAPDGLKMTRKGTPEKQSKYRPAREIMGYAGVRPGLNFDGKWRPWTMNFCVAS
jgi:hypothetical protein